MRLAHCVTLAAALLAPNAVAAPLPQAPGCPVFPASNVWNKRVDKLPRHRRSAAIVRADRRPRGWTSADAAGLPILPGLARYYEVARGVIDHALRFTVRRSRRA